MKWLAALFLVFLGHGVAAADDAQCAQNEASCVLEAAWSAVEDFNARCIVPPWSAERLARGPLPIKVGRGLVYSNSYQRALVHWQEIVYSKR